MKRLNIKCTYFLIGAFSFLILSSNAFGNVFLKNENIVDKRAVGKIELIGKELKEKTGVNTYVVAIYSLHGEPLVKYEQNISKALKSPYILLSLAVDDKQVDIISSKDMEDKFDRAGVLSPYPMNGTILPILASKKGKDKYSAAILNGYGDIVEQISQSYGIKLESGIGNANKTVINVIKVFFYSFVVLTIIIIIYRRRKRVGRD